MICSRFASPRRRHKPMDGVASIPRLLRAFFCPFPLTYAYAGHRHFPASSQPLKRRRSQFSRNNGLIEKKSLCNVELDADLYDLPGRRCGPPPMRLRRAPFLRFNGPWVSFCFVSDSDPTRRSRSMCVGRPSARLPNPNDPLGLPMRSSSFTGLVPNAPLGFQCLEFSPAPIILTSASFAYPKSLVRPLTYFLRFLLLSGVVLFSQYHEMLLLSLFLNFQACGRPHI
ncbi:hypothetical protein K438DRAFT_1218995 [Mycena galopus ATCC 62051]|nr:hypothetical protein K438DRAFT_1218995 [Mycena galopus ATCC 62051]